MITLGWVQARRCSPNLWWVPSDDRLACGAYSLLPGTEESLGKAIKASGIPREELFITTKIP